MVPAVVAALFGSSWHLVSGPTTAASIVLCSSVSVLAEPGSEPAEPATAVAASAADADAALEIELRFTEDSWTEITAASGERLFYGLASAGRGERILTDDEVSVRLGNAGGVSIRVHGEPFAFPPGSRRGTLAVFRLSPPED